MIAKLALLFTTVTLLELAIIIPLGQAIGLLPTVAIVLGTAVLGASLAKRQGLTIWQRIQKELSTGQLPKDSLLDGLAVLIAGAFLLTPGVLTDIAGLLLLLPPARVPLKAIAKKYGKTMLESPDVEVQTGGNIFGQGFANEVNQDRVDGQPGARRAGEFAGQRQSTDATDDEPTAKADAGDDVIDVEPIESDRTSTSDDDEPDTSDNRVDPIGELSTSTD